MKVIIDANRIVAALVKHGTTRSILFDEDFEFLAPDHSLAEINDHKEELQRKTKLTAEEFDILISIISERITIIPESEYAGFFQICRQDVRDADDVPYLAACLASKAQGIWSHDPHFSTQNRVRVFTNIDMLNFSRKAIPD
jgi:predicted nucleic acid-binding protein